VISNTGNFDTAKVEIGGTPVQVMFAPGRGRQIGAEIAARIDTASERLLVASMVISSGPILGAIADRMHRVNQFGGIFDGPEMHIVMREWGRSRDNAQGEAPAARRAAASSGKADQFAAISKFLHVKPSLPFSDAGVHNFMHNKFVVIDDTVVTGSFNLSTNAQSNAENVVLIESKELADAYTQYAQELMTKYPAMGSAQERIV
jgi:phosphatidylserine/phosphatidylglycerophosphate/cardiolipin synthase-like enzyme